MINIESIYKLGDAYGLIVGGLFCLIGFGVLALDINTQIDQTIVFGIVLAGVIINNILYQWTDNEIERIKNRLLGQQLKVSTRYRELYRIDVIHGLSHASTASVVLMTVISAVIVFQFAFGFNDIMFAVIGGIIIETIGTWLYIKYLKKLTDL